MTDIIEHTYVVGSGMFAEFKRILRVGYRCMLYNKHIYINWENEYFPYKDGSTTNPVEEYLIINVPEYNKELVDFFSYVTYDEHIFFIPEILNSHGITNPNDYCKNWNAITLLRKIKLQSTDIANNESIIKRNHCIMIHKLFTHCFSINSSILEEANQYFCENMKEYFTIGVHVRAHSAHNCEMNNEPIETDEQIVKELDNYIVAHNLHDYRIYLATDINESLCFFKNKYGNKLLFNKQNIWMSGVRTDRFEPHFGFDTQHPENQNDQFKELFHHQKPGLKGGRELLKDCLLLSKCSVFRHSLSNLSDYVYIFNPYINDLIYDN